MSNTVPDIQMCVADDATFWPWFRWPEFANWADKATTVVVIPIVGLADYGLVRGLDAEECVLMPLLREASKCRAPDVKLLVVPPMRYAIGPKSYCAFSIPPDVACEQIEEVATWVGAAGFTKILLLNASPWNEELTKAVGRDLRIEKRLQMFCVQLSALGLDFDPVRGGDRSKLKAVLESLVGGGSTEGSQILEATARRLASIIGEMSRHPPLANGGVLESKTWP